MNVHPQPERQDAADAWGAFCPGGKFDLAGSPGGPLGGLRVAVKDLFDVAGHRTGAGNPDWLKTHDVPARNALAVDMLLSAGARVVGKTITDELAYSLNGENHHYGTPVNPVTPGRIPGGSSCGSAVAVAAGLCDIGLGSDTAGSIRLPASYCGVWGFRPSHGAVPGEGVVPLAPGYDAVGWMAADADTLVRAGEVLLPPDREYARPASRPGPRLLVPQDAWALADPGIRDALSAPLATLQSRFLQVGRDAIAAEGLQAWQQIFRTIQGREVWATHGEWITRCRPDFGPGVRERFAWASTITAEAADAASAQRTRIAQQLDDVLEDAVLCIPTVPFVAPMKNSPTAEEDRTRALSLLCIASLGRLPQVTMPLAGGDACAVGLSLIGRRGTDRSLLALAASGGPDAGRRIRIGNSTA